MRPTPDTLKLPAKLVHEIGGRELLERKQKLYTVNTRRERRKAERIQKKVERSGPPPTKKVKTRHLRVQDGDHHDSKLHPPSPESSSREIGATITKQRETSDPLSYGTVLPPSSPIRLSRAVRDRLAEDDMEIADLERRLGIKGKKALPQAFKDDGLDDLLEGLGRESSSGLMNNEIQDNEGRDWLFRKRIKVALRLEAQEKGEGHGKETKDGSEKGDDVLSSAFSLKERGGRDLAEESHKSDIDDEFEGFESDSTRGPQQLKRPRENPYVAPIASGSPAPAKYIPPSLRTIPADESGGTKLRRQAQGLINRLTETNLLSVLGEIERLFRENARQHVTSTLTDLMLMSLCEPSTLPDTLIILPAGFITAIYKTIGIDFGAYVVQRVVELFEEHYVDAMQGSHLASIRATSDSSKVTSNLIALLAQLYNFQVVGCNLIFDYIRLFLKTFTELNAELLLKIIRTSGSQLRQDDPSSLKDIVNMIQPAVTVIGDSNVSVRTKYMIETINDLKNNRLKTGAVASAINSEHTVRMKKTLGNLSTRSMKGTEPLRIGLKDIKESDKRGKWWLVGASWTGKEKEVDHGIRSSSQIGNEIGGSENRNGESGAFDLIRLAREQRMNTDIRRAIFVSIMSASDCQDAYSRLLKLRLKKAQELEIPRVLIQCSGAEQIYNPYYTLIATKLCGDRRLKMAFQFSLWDLFKRMGENNNDEDYVHDGENEDEDDPLNTRRVVNLAKMFGTLIVDGALSLMVLKNLNLHYLKRQTKMFLEVMFIAMFTQSQRHPEIARDKSVVANVVSKVKDSPSLTMGVRYFLQKVVIKTDIAGSRADEETISWACRVAAEVLETGTI